MDQSTPESAFESVQQAVAAQDWPAVFRCLDRNDLLKICANSVRGVAEFADDESEQLFEEFGFPVQEMRDLDEEMMASGMRLMQEAREGKPVDMKTSLAHNKLVKKADKFLDANLRRVKQLPEFTAALELQMRSRRGGGSISSTLFQGEYLDELLSRDKKAFGTRVNENGYVEQVEFVKKRNRWYIRLITS